jgi:AraC-like DNA-binding protein
MLTAATSTRKWSRDGLRVMMLLYAGNNLDKARRIFERTHKNRPRIRLTTRQRMRVLDEWPRLGFRVPRDAIAPLAGGIDDALIRVVPAGVEAIKLLVTYARAIAEEQQSLDTPELQRLVATHIHDLLALAVGATRDGRAIAGGRGVRAARLRAIMSDITANLGDCDLTVAAVAQRQRVTPRYLHKLFEGEEITFSTFVLGQRLSRAHRMLCDPRFGDRSISSVAFDVGFGDLSYFNRTFRRRYDATPSDIRHSAGRNDSSPCAS